jgi:sporulation protein YlmC with PRC-barrel domain
MSPIINPNNLKIEGFYCQIRGDKQQLVLLAQDIRDLIPQGFVINDQDVLSPVDELVRLKNIINLHFELLGKQVVTLNGTKVGKVGDYAVDTQSMFVHKLYASQSLLKHLSGGMLSIDRTQITEITDKNIIINDLQQKVPVQARAVA